MIPSLRILLVDDEPHVLAALRRMIFMRRPQWDIACAESAVEALAMMEARPADIIVSDVMMPGMDGAMLLKIVREKWPATIRIALSGQVGINQVVQSIRCVHQYIGKPCEGDMLIRKIELMVECREVLLDPDMQRLVAAIDTLPVVPEVFLAIQGEFERPDPSIEKIASLIQRDMSLVAKVLSLVNSPFFGLARWVQDIQQAISLLGLDIIRATILTSSMFMSYEKMGLADLSIQSLSEHSFRVATICRCLAANLGMGRHDIMNCTTAAMLHDVGKLALAASYPDKFRQVVDLLVRDGIPLVEGERMVFGTTHAELGAYMLALWGMEGAEVRAIGLHHRHAAFDSSPPMLLHVADVMDHNCVRLRPDHCAHRFNPGIAENGEQRARLQEWAGIVHEKWAGLNTSTPFDPAGLFPGA